MSVNTEENILGLAIGVGVLAELLEEDPEGAEWMEDGFAAANRLLAAADLPLHTEPRVLAPLESRASLDSFPYSFIHYLRRAYAYRVDSPNWVATPLDEGDDPSADEVLEEVAERFESHLLFHSDAEGFYLPVEFDDVLVADPGDEEAAVPGELLGSSYRLREELVLVAPALGITLTGDGHLSDAEAARIDGIACSDDGLCREMASWLSLFEAARLSIQYKTAIVFS